jgi:raffinose/stachyose/melibiose transport system substrate-binding protein
MKWLNKAVAITIAASLLVLPLAGCSGGDSNSASETQSSGTEEEAVTLELFSTKTENAEILNSLANEFHTQNPSITITVSNPQDASTVLRTRLTKNDIPDILAMGGDATFTELQSAGVLEDLSQEPSAANIQDSYKQMVYDVQENKEGALYGLPYATNASGVLYNEDIFEEEGAEVPKTWDDFIALCEKLKADGITPLELCFKDAWCTLPPWNSMAPDLQPENFTDDRRAGKTTFAATHVEIAKKYLQLLQFAQNDYMGTTYADGNNAFAQGMAAMTINGNWAISEIKKVNPDVKVNLFAFPASNDSSKNYVTSGVDVLFAVSADSPHKDAAKKFIAFMMEKTTAKKYIENQFAFSAIKGVEQEDPSLAGVKQDIADGKVANYPDHYYPAGFDLTSIIQNFVKNAAKGMDPDKNVADFLKQCDEKYDAANVT